MLYNISISILTLLLPYFFVVDFGQMLAIGEASFFHQLSRLMLLLKTLLLLNVYSLFIQLVSSTKAFLIQLNWHVNWRSSLFFVSLLYKYCSSLPFLFLLKKNRSIGYDLFQNRVLTSIEKRCQVSFSSECVYFMI